MRTPGRDAQQAREAVQQQARAGEQHQRQRDFGDHEPIAEAAIAAAGRQRAA